MHIHMMRAPKTRTAVRQDQITRSALALISRHGLRRLNVAGVARAVGVVPSALYRHYRSKDAMLAAVLDLISQRMRGNVEAARRASPDPFERLRLLLQRHIHFVREEVPLPRVVFSEEVFHGPAARRRQVYRLFSDYVAGIADIIREGQHSGSIRADMPADTLAVTFLGLIQPAAILWLMSDGEFDVARHAEESWRVFCSAIQVPAESGPVLRMAQVRAAPAIKIQRVHEMAPDADGKRFLVDRLWPRGVKKSALRLDGWLKAVAPSDALRRWFGHEPAKWPEFRRRYFAELDRQPESWRPILPEAGRGPVTLLFSARDTEHNNAVALREYLLSKALPDGNKLNRGDSAGKESAPASGADSSSE